MAKNLILIFLFLFQAAPAWAQTVYTVEVVGAGPKSEELIKWIAVGLERIDDVALVGEGGVYRLDVHTVDGSGGYIYSVNVVEPLHIGEVLGFVRGGLTPAAAEYLVANMVKNVRVESRALGQCGAAGFKMAGLHLAEDFNENTLADRRALEREVDALIRKDNKKSL